MPSPPSKRVKVAHARSHSNSTRRDQLVDNDRDSDQPAEAAAADGPDDSDTYGSGDSFSDSESPGTEKEIADAKRVKSKKTLKRHRRATEPSNFGATLKSLLGTETPSALPLSLNPGPARRKFDQQLELKAKSALRLERKNKEDNGRVRDVIGDWGIEGERALRKVAQRGVVKLFNVIQQSQAASSAAIEKSKASRGTGKPSLPAPAIPSKTKGKAKGKADGIPVEKDVFFEMLRSGGVVSKA